MKIKYDDIRKYTSVLYRQFQMYLNNNIKDLDISVSEYHYLMAIFENNNVSQEELSKILIIDKAATARTIKSLEQKNYIVRSKDLNDKRTNRISLTKKGKELQNRLYSHLIEWEDLITKDFEEDTLQIVLNTIREMSLKAIKLNKMNNVTTEENSNE